VLFQKTLEIAVYIYRLV